LLPSTLPQKQHEHLKIGDWKFDTFSLLDSAPFYQVAAIVSWIWVYYVKKYMKNKQKAGHQYARVTQNEVQSTTGNEENALSARNNILIMACYNHHLTWYSIIPYIPGTTTRGPLKSPAQFPVPAKAPISVETIFGYTCNVILPSMIIVTSFVSIAALPTQQTSSTAGQIEPGTNVPVLEAGFWLESFLSVDFNLGTIIGFFEGGGWW